MAVAKQRNVRKGMLFALAGFGLLSLGDALVKSLAGNWPGTAVAALRYTMGALLLGTILFAREGRAGFTCPMPRTQVARGASIALGTSFFFLSLFAMPIAEVTVIQFISPMLVALLSMLLLGERAPRAAIIAAGFAFVGVVMILRPEAVSLGWAVLLPLTAALGISLMMVFNQRVAGQGSVVQMQFLISAFAVPFLLAGSVAGHWSGIAALHIGWPDAKTVGVCAVIACSASLSHALIYQATVEASAAAIAPMVYVQLLVALFTGFAFFDEWPDAWALAGGAVIIASGLWLWRQSGRASHQASSTESQ